MLKKREMARMAGMAGTRCDAMRCEGQKVIWTGSWRGFWRQRSPGRSGRKDCRKARQRRQSFSFEFVRFLLGRSRARVPDVTAMMSSARRLGSLVAPNPVLTLIFRLLAISGLINQSQLISLSHRAGLEHLQREAFVSIHWHTSSPSTISAIEVTHILSQAMHDALLSSPP